MSAPVYLVQKPIDSPKSLFLRHQLESDAPCYIEDDIEKYQQFIERQTNIHSQIRSRGSSCSNRYGDRYRVNSGSILSNFSKVNILEGTNPDFSSNLTDSFTYGPLGNDDSSMNSLSHLKVLEGKMGASFYERMVEVQEFLQSQHQKRFNGEGQVEVVKNPFKGGFSSKIVDLDSHGKTDEAIDLLYDEVLELLEEKPSAMNTAMVNDYLAGVKVPAFTTTFLLAILTITLPWKDMLGNRAPFYRKVQDELSKRVDERKVRRLLSGLNEDI